MLILHLSWSWSWAVDLVQLIFSLGKIIFSQDQHGQDRFRKWSCDVWSSRKRVDGCRSGKWVLWDHPSSSFKSHPIVNNRDEVDLLENDLRVLFEVDGLRKWSPVVETHAAFWIFISQSHAISILSPHSSPSLPLLPPSHFYVTKKWKWSIFHHFHPWECF